ncbi:MAG: C4-dicarboxylate ABC transporter [Peptococcaceae bacterium BICA1-7]|nr:MAG: C4-dicarboxylate ABC transporter [Peptococcaceae bacterium BICA1-7]HBV96968.1 C4-dicarboxylate ABC transporter [Desulfotomaculum sp.]
MKLFKQLKLALAALFLLTALSGCTEQLNDWEQVSPKEKIVIKFSHVVSEDTPKGLAAKRFADLVNHRTGGRVEVQVFPNSTLYRDGEEIQALLSGAVQIIAPSTSKLGDMFPRWQIFDMPYAFESFADINRSMEGKIGSSLYEDLEKGGIQPLAFWYNGFKQITSRERPIIHPNDFKDLRFRIMINSAILEEQFSRLGAIPVKMQFNEVYQALSSSAIDGQENTTSNIVSQKFYETQPYLTVSNHGFLGYSVITSQDFWSELPPDVRNIIQETMKEVSLWEMEQASIINNRDMEKLRNSGKIEIHVQTPVEREEWKNALKSVDKKLIEIAGPDLAGEIINKTGQ